MVENFKFVDVMSAGDVRLKLCSYQKKPNDVTIFIYLFLPQEISKSLFVKIRLRYRFDRHQSPCHQEVIFHVTIIIDLRLEVFSVLFKFHTT